MLYGHVFNIYIYWVDILNILLLDLDRHSHPPFLNISAVFINVAISYQKWNLESCFWYQCIGAWIAISNSSNILHLTLMWPTQPPFNKMAHVKSNCLHICLTIYFEGCYMDSFVKTYVCWGSYFKYFTFWPKPTFTFAIFQNGGPQS